MMIILHLLPLTLLLDLTWSLGNDSTEVTEVGRSGSRGIFRLNLRYKVRIRHKRNIVKITMVASKFKAIDIDFFS